MTKTAESFRKEPQTRWMAIHTPGMCAALDTPVALRAPPKAEAFIEADSGACLWGATIRYLGDVGATSEANARTVFPLLGRALRIAGRESDGHHKDETNTDALRISM